MKYELHIKHVREMSDVQLDQSGCSWYYVVLDDCICQSDQVALVLVAHRYVHINNTDPGSVEFIFYCGRYYQTDSHLNSWLYSGSSCYPVRRVQPMLLTDVKGWFEEAVNAQNGKTT